MKVNKILLDFITQEFTQTYSSGSINLYVRPHLPFDVCVIQTIVAS